MTYTVKELFLTVQGEGANLGRVAVFIRFAGCNLWSGREEDRARSVCTFCDTDFVGGERFAGPAALADAAAAMWPADDGGERFIPARIGDAGIMELVPAQPGSGRPKA